MNALIAILCLCATGGDARVETPRLSGGFIQISPPWYKQRIYDWKEGTLAEKKQCCLNLWQREFANLHRIGIRTVVVQFTVTAESAGNKLCFDPGGQVMIGGVPFSADQHDVVYLSLGAIMDNAEKTGIDVWLGLRQKDSWNRDGWPAIVSSSESVIQEMADVAIALQSTKLLGSERFAGWYVVPEIDNRKPEGKAVKAVGQTGNLMLKKLISKLRDVSDKPVAISGFFHPGNGNVDEKAFLGLLSDTLRGSGIKVFIFQDSVGVEDSTTAPETHLTQQAIAVLEGRYRSVSDAAGEAIETWADVELMVGGGDNAPATNVDRLSDQLTATNAGQKVVSKVVSFAPSHYMTILGGRPGADKLFRDFYRVATGQEFTDVPVQGCPALK